MYAKQEKIKLEDSNLALYGSDTHKDVRKAAADSEPAWEGAGTAPGIRVWRIEKFEVKDWPKKRYGEFYSGDSYIVLNSYKVKEEKKLRHNVHFWLGAETSQDEAGTAAYKTVELDDKLGDVPVQYREVQGHETHMFRRLFPKLKLLKGGVDSGFNKVKPEEYNARLLHLKGKKTVRIMQVPLTHESLNNGDVFILDNGLSLIQWNGPKSSFLERTRARELIEEMKEERHSKAESVILDGLENHEEFWKLLGGKPEKIAPATEDDDVEASIVMYELKHSSSGSELDKVAEGMLLPFSKLNAGSVYIVDNGHVCYVWIGKQASTQERNVAIVTAMSYLKAQNMSQATPIVRVLDGNHTTYFNKCFEGTVAEIGRAVDEEYFTSPTAKLTGVLEVSISEAKNLKSGQIIGTADPYAFVTLGKKKYRSKTCENGGKAAKWTDKPFQFDLQRIMKRDDAPETLEIEIKNENIIKDDRIGSFGIQVMELVNAPGGTTKEWVQILGKNGKPTGEILLTVQYKAPLTIVIEGGKDLQDTSTFGRQSPYVKMKVGNQLRFRTGVCKDGHDQPKYEKDNSFEFNPVLLDKSKIPKISSAKNSNTGGVDDDGVAHYMVEFKVKASKVLKDSLIGYASVPLAKIQEQKPGEPVEYQLYFTQELKQARGFVIISTKV